LDYQCDCITRVHFLVELRGLIVKKGYDFSKESLDIKREEVTGGLEAVAY
jgi:hypothetical protein